MTEKILRNKIKALRLRNEQLPTVSNTEWYSLFKDEIRNSIAIEGVFTNRQDLADVLDNNKRTNKQKAAAILGYFESAGTMYEYANNQFKENEFALRMADIKQIHTILMRYEKEIGIYIGEVGEFRKTTAEVTQSTFTPCDHFYLREVMELFVDWVNSRLKKKSVSPVGLAAQAHAWFETIHPFTDGNGRVGRILLNYILVGCGLLNVAIKGASPKDRDAYYDLLEQSDDYFEKLIRQVEHGQKIKLGDIDNKVILKSCTPLQDMLEALLEDVVSKLEKSQKPIQANAEAIIPLRDLAELYNYSQDYLRNLINRGQLKARKKGKLWYVKVKDMAAYVSSQQINSVRR